MNKAAIVSTLLIVFISTALFSQEAVQTVKPRNIILLIGDGMGVSHTEAMITVVGDQVNLLRFEQAALVRTFSFDKYITDSAASATAYASGVKTKNGYLGTDPYGKRLASIMEEAMELGLLTALVASSSITHATPAAFASHVESRGEYEEIAAQMAVSGVDVMIGGGRDHFGVRKDSKNYLDTLSDRGYSLPETIEELNNIKEGKVAALLYPVQPPSIKNGRGDFLSIGTAKALEILDAGNKGFILMVEASQIDWASHKHQKNSVLLELKDFDKVIGIALDFAEKDGETLVIVTADHETGAYHLKGGDIEKKEIEGGFSTLGHTGTMVPLLASGPGADAFNGIIDNTDLYHIMSRLLGTGAYSKP